MSGISTGAPMRRVCALYALSGFVALGYQVSWFRIFVDWFGSTTLIFGLVVCAFIGGLGVGALSSRRLAQFICTRTGISDSLRIYGLIEVAIAIAAIATVGAEYLPPDLWGSFPYDLTNGMWTPAPGYAAFQLTVAAVCVLIPCFLMGATFPLLCAGYLATPEGARLPARLYAWNTLGACSGVLVSQFVLLPILGHRMMFTVLIGLNILLGAYFLVTGGGPDIPAAGRGPVQATRSRSGQATAWHLLLPAAILSGFMAGALEGDLAKRTGFFIVTTPGATMPLISFWAILGIFFASTLVHRARGLRLSLIKVAFLAAAATYLLTTIWADALMEFMQKFMASSPTSVGLFPGSNLQLFAFVGVLTFVPYFLISLLLPYICNRAQAEQTHLGLAYGLNTVAFCVGLLVFSYAAPAVSIFFSLKLAVSTMALGAFAVLLLSETKHRGLWALPAAIAVFLGLWLVVPRQFDRDYFLAGSFPARYPVSFVRSNAAATTFVVDIGSNRRLFFGRLSMSGTNAMSQAYMRLMAHFPLLTQATPRSALLICFGVGNTASAIAAHSDLRRIDIVDLNRNVLETSAAFARFNRRVTEDPRVRLIVDDGRNFLNRTTEKYDLITSEPPPPLAAGVYRLYSAEYYATARSHLTEHGLMSQWLPVYGMTSNVARKAITTFLSVFPHAVMITGYGSDFVLVGGTGPINLANIASRFGSQAEVVADLQRIGVFSQGDLVAHVVSTDRQLRARYQEPRVISDLHNDLDHIFMDPRDMLVIPYEPYSIIDELRRSNYPVTQQLSDVLLHLGRLRYHARGFPYQSLDQVRSQTRKPVALAAVDWNQIDAFDELSWAASDARRPLDAIHWMNEALRTAPEQPEMLLRVADLEARLQRFAPAVERLTELILLEPESAQARDMRAQVLSLTGRASEALIDLRAAMSIRPAWAEPFNSAAWILATHPDPEIRNPAEAIRLAGVAVGLTVAKDPMLLDTLAVAYAAAGRSEDASRTIEKAIELNALVPAAEESILREHLQIIQANGMVFDQSLLGGASAGSRN